MILLSWWTLCVKSSIAKKKKHNKIYTCECFRHDKNSIIEIGNQRIMWGTLVVNLSYSFIHPDRISKLKKFVIIFMFIEILYQDYQIERRPKSIWISFFLQIIFFNV